MNAEKNRNKRRDKKIARKKAGMRVDDSARKLARFKEVQAISKKRRLTLKELEDLINYDPNIDHGPRRDGAPNWVADPRFPA